MEQNHPDLRIFPDYDITKIHDYLTTEQSTALKYIRDELPLDMDDDAKKWWNDATLCRFLRARDWDYGKTKTMVSNSIDWRAKYKPHKITAQDVIGELKNNGRMYRNDYDKYGRPILYMKPGLDNTGANEREEKVKYLVYLMEKCALAANKNNREKILLIIDFKGHNQISGMSNIKVSLEVLQILQDNYPETLGVAIMCNAPWSFTIFWNIISPFLHEITREKVKFIKDEKEFLQYVDAEHLETTYGGNNNFKYIFEEHWDKEDKEFPINL